MNNELKSRFECATVFKTPDSQNRQDLVNDIVRCLEGKGAWPEGKEIFYGEETKWDDLNRDSPQTSGEFSILSHNYGGLCSALEHVDWIVELGVGTGIDTKARRILEMKRGIRCYIGVDRNRKFVYDHIGRLCNLFPQVRCMGLVGEFDDAYHLLVEISNDFKYKNGCLLSLGSTISNSSPEKLIQTLRHWSCILPNMIIGQDSNTDEKSVAKAYRSPAFIQFIWAGLRQVNKYLEEESFVTNTKFVKEEFEVKIITRPGPPFTVEAAITARDGMTKYFKDGREVTIFTAYKYQQEDFIALVREANNNASIKVFKANCTESRIYSITFPTQDVMDLTK